MLRPISQTGFPRVPANPNQRNYDEGVLKQKRTVLGGFNEQSDERQLHPTKGWRKLNVKRTRAQMLMNLIRQGAAIPVQLQARFLRLGYMQNFGGN